MKSMNNDYKIILDKLDKENSLLINDIEIEEMKEIKELAELVNELNLQEQVCTYTTA